MSTLQISNLHVQVATSDGPKPILNGVDLTIASGEVHAIMGPNGSGKSTLAYSIAGHPDYEVTEGEVFLDGVNLLEMSVDERARAGLFLAMEMLLSHMLGRVFLLFRGSRLLFDNGLVAKAIL